MPSPSTEVSLVIPVFNEAPNLKPLFSDILETMDAYGKSFEVLMVDDGSSDDSLDVMKELQKTDERLRVIALARNFGQNPAVYAAFSQVRGDIVVTLDADRQNPPQEIPKLLDRMAEGYDMVQGWRQERQDSVFRKTVSRMINLAASKITGKTIKDLGCGLKAYRREVVDRFNQSSHHSRYLPAEAAWMGLHTGEVEVAHQPRAAGEAKYGIFSLLRVSFDMLVSISTAPLQIIGLLGGFFSLVGFAMTIRIGYMRVVYDNTFNHTATVSALFFFLAGIQMICTSIMCQYISRIYTEVQQRPYFVIKDIIE
jgi:undecaprenyl-phosphate 4-deoxy-4-formamido-L-arabinose transferase